jgi:acyl carrier protein phosphodiesterase
MTNYDSVDLHKRVERYVVAVDELRAAHLDVRELLHDHVLFEKWQELGAELGYSAMRQQTQSQAHRDLSALSNQIPEMSDSWSS